MIQLRKRSLVVAVAACLLLFSAASGAAASAETSKEASAPAASGTAFKQILAGTYYSVALRADGTVWTWGRNLWGELGVLKENAVTAIAAPVRLPNLSGMTAISTNGTGMQVGLKKDGTVWEWGSIAGSKSSPRDSELPKQVAGLANVKAAAAFGAGGGIALQGDGKLFAWTHDAAAGGLQLRQVPGAYDWTDMTSGGNIVTALDAQGSVWGIRANQDADGGTSVPTPFRMTGLPAMKQVSGGGSLQYGKLYGVDRKGSAWSWELNPKSLTAGAGTAPATLPVKAVQMHQELRVKEIQGGFYGILLTENGEVCALDKGTTGKSGTVGTLSGIVSIAAGYHHNLALDDKGRIWGWGGDKWYESGSLTSSRDGMLYAPTPIQPAISVYVNGRLLVSPFPARIDNGSVSVPMKAALQALGGTFASNPADNTTKFAYKQKTAVLHPDGSGVRVNDTQEVSLPAIKRGFSGVTMIPAFLLKLLGVQATWDAKLGELRLDGNP
ncbi:stalk domain-containing protein [Paenibacillus sacheonensis]|uniref:Copper amine oxidase-like N-terminal domain-containing protein n=1 Tax=Paenibacillus sacheonensis TaxID=742054 RepID=A0A7X5C3R8_9BACL|nr:stalk domain-containing protein [Paenibacillus sacheonensis]MBM7569014.1 alpha-tubulin suppressor-like RCC1 family protein [Paenibacillus sacheonensis]NBC72615.1 hypothetical protein [Paenibacillus sacheonensis]